MPPMGTGFHLRQRQNIGMEGLHKNSLCRLIGEEEGSFIKIVDYDNTDNYYLY